MSAVSELNSEKTYKPRSHRLQHDLPERLPQPTTASAHPDFKGNPAHLGETRKSKDIRTGITPRQLLPTPMAHEHCVEPPFLARYFELEPGGPVAYKDQFWTRSGKMTVGLKEEVEVLLP